MRSPSRGRLGRVFREPLTHFLIGGAALLGLYRWVAPAPTDTVVVSDDTERWLVEQFERANGRPPGEVERAAIVQRHVDEEVLYREGIALGIDRSDPIVRRRVVQRMQLLLEDLRRVDPDEASLAAFHRDHADAYRLPDTVDLEHVFFAGEDARPRAQQLLPALADGATLDGRGDAFVHGSQALRHGRSQLVARFGPEFTAAVEELEIGVWAVVASSYGWHVVRVKERTPGAALPLAKVRARVLADWRRARVEASGADTLQALRGRYRVRRELEG